MKREQLEFPMPIPRKPTRNVQLQLPLRGAEGRRGRRLQRRFTGPLKAFEGHHKEMPDSTRCWIAAVDAAQAKSMLLQAMRDANYADVTFTALRIKRSPERDAKAKKRGVFSIPLPQPGK